MADASASRPVPERRRVRNRRNQGALSHNLNLRLSVSTSKTKRRSQRIKKLQRSTRTEFDQQRGLSQVQGPPFREAACSPQSDPQRRETNNPLSTRSSPRPKPKRRLEDAASQTSLEPPRKRARASLAAIREEFDQEQISASTERKSDRFRHWQTTGYWRSEAEERAMQNFRDNYVSGALARRRSSLGRKRSSGSLITDTISSGDQKASSEKNTYRDVRVQIELKEIGSFMDDHEDGVTTASKELCQKLLNSPQELPIDTLFSDDLFPGVCKMVKGQNEATVVRYILPQLVPSAKIRALRGSKHLRILNETIDASWINAIKCCGRRPQPDYGLGVRREAFSREQLRKLQPFIGTQMDEESMFAATYDTCFPFLTTEVTCGATALDIADRQNALSQTIALRGLVTLFRLVGREQELHREIVGFSFSHDDEAVRIFGHYPYIDGKDTTYHRTPIAKFDFSPTAEGDKRWKTPTFVMNLQDLWASDHFELICSAVDMLPPDLNFEVTPQPEIEMYHRSEASEQSPQPSGLSQQLEDSIITDEEHVQTQGDHPITPDTSTHTAGRKKKRIAKLSKT